MSNPIREADVRRLIEAAKDAIIDMEGCIEKYHTYGFRSESCRHTKVVAKLKAALAMLEATGAMKRFRIWLRDGARKFKQVKYNRVEFDPDGKVYVELAPPESGLRAWKIAHMLGDLDLSKAIPDNVKCLVQECITLQNGFTLGDRDFFEVRELLEDGSHKLWQKGSLQYDHERNAWRMKGFKDWEEPELDDIEENSELFIERESGRMAKVIVVITANELTHKVKDGEVIKR